MEREGGRERRSNEPLLLGSSLIRFDLGGDELVVPLFEKKKGDKRTRSVSEREAEERRRETTNEVKMMLRLLVRDLDLVQPLDRTTTDLSRDDESKRES